MNPKLIHNVCKKVKERMDFLDYDIKIIPKPIDTENEDKLKKTFISKAKKEGITEEEANKQYIVRKYDRLLQENDDAPFKEAYIKAGIQEILNRSGFAKVFMGDNGIKTNVVDYGDQFVSISEVSGDFPIRLQALLTEDVAVEASATAIRGTANGKDAQRVVISYQLDYDKFMTKVVPTLPKKSQEIAKSIVWGFLPDSEQREKKFDQSDTQSGQDEDYGRMGEFLIYFDLENEEVVQIAGSNGVILQRLSGNKFPIKKDGEMAIPIAHFRGLESKEGVYSWGVGHYMYQPNNVSKIIDNKTISGSIKNVDPLQYIQGKPGGRGEFEALVYRAEQEISHGRPGIIYDEHDESGNYATGNVQTLSTTVSTTPTSIVSEIINKQIVDLGIGLQEVQTDASKTATAIDSEQATANLLVRWIQSRNAPEYKFLIELIIEIAKKRIKKNNKLTVDTSNINTIKPEQQLFLRNLTLGKIVEELNNVDYRIKMDALSGVAPNPVIQAQKLRSAFGLTAGRPVSDKILQKLVSKQTGMNIELDDLKITDQEAQKAQASTLQESQSSSSNPNDLPL